MARAQPHVAWQSRDLGAVIDAAFKLSGLTQNEKIVLLAAIGSIEGVTLSSKGGMNSARVDSDVDEDALFPADGGIFLPNTFGSQKEMFGQLLSTVRP